MASSTATKLWTIDQWEELERDGVTVELLRGELIEMPGPKFQHWYIVGRLLHFVWEFVNLHRLGAVGSNGAFVLQRDPDTALIPDVAFVRADRMPPDDSDWDVYLGAPDCAFEVVSPSDPAVAVHDKTIAYLDAGVRAVVNVWPRSQSVSVHRSGSDSRELGIDDTLDLDDVIPGFRLAVADIFRRD
jgi:Uma2 family endonuclease